MAEKFGRLATDPPSDSEPILEEVKDSNVRSHIQSLNNMLGMSLLKKHVGKKYFIYCC